MTIIRILLPMAVMFCRSLSKATNNLTDYDYYDNQIENTDVTPICSPFGIPRNSEAYNCTKIENGFDVICNIRCKDGYSLKGFPKILCKWPLFWDAVPGNSLPICKNILKKCSYPPVLPTNLYTEDCYLKHGTVAKCNLICKSSSLEKFIFGEREIFCNFNTGQWVQKKSKKIATTCKEEFTCASCEYMKCPPLTTVKCKNGRCACICSVYFSCDEFKCPNATSEPYCKRDKTTSGECDCLTFEDY